MLKTSFPKKNVFLNNFKISNSYIKNVLYSIGRILYISYELFTNQNANKSPSEYFRLSLTLNAARLV